MIAHGDTQPYRGIRFGVYEEGQDVWQWAFYPKVGRRIVNRGQVKGRRQAAIAACKAAIDGWLTPTTSNEDTTPADCRLPKHSCKSTIKVFDVVLLGSSRHQGKG